MLNWHVLGDIASHVNLLTSKTSYSEYQVNAHKHYTEKYNMLTLLCLRSRFHRGVASIVTFVLLMSALQGVIHYISLLLYC